jgi:transcription termination factor Rho
VTNRDQQPEQVASVAISVKETVAAALFDHSGEEHTLVWSAVCSGRNTNKQWWFIALKAFDWIEQ